MEYSKVIREAGLKVTQQRRIVYESMSRLEHSSIECVINDVRGTYPDISVATIYRIMDYFCEAGLLLKFVSPTGKVFYDINPKEHFHYFTSEDQIVDIFDDDLTEMIRQRLSSQLPPKQRIDKISVSITTSYKNSLTD